MSSMDLLWPDELEHDDGSSAHVRAYANDVEIAALDLTGVQRIDLHFPLFSDGRALTQAVQLRRRRAFTGELRATGDVLVDLLPFLQRCGFSQAVLRADQDRAAAQRALGYFTGGRYQGDAKAPRQPITVGTSSPSVVGWVPPTTTRPSSHYLQRLEHTCETLRDAVKRYGPVVQASSLGAEDMVVTHLALELGLALPWFVIDTGRLHAQTLQLLATLPEPWRERLRVVRPEPTSVLEFERQHRAEEIFKDVAIRKACCEVRKVAPLQSALQGYSAWITGMRREQSAERQRLERLQWVDGRYKVNPLADWTWGDVWHYLRQHAVPTNPLHDANYPSIGCEPCTRAISAGEPLRAGRWWWEEEGASKECGLHRHANADVLPVTTPSRP